jgi:hypothetical protein
MVKVSRSSHLLILWHQLLKLLTKRLQPTTYLICLTCKANLSVSVKGYKKYSLDLLHRKTCCAWYNIAVFMMVLLCEVFRCVIVNFFDKKGSSKTFFENKYGCFLLLVNPCYLSSG